MFENNLNIEVIKDEFIQEGKPALYFDTIWEQTDKIVIFKEEFPKELKIAMELRVESNENSIDHIDSENCENYILIAQILDFSKLNDFYPLIKKFDFLCDGILKLPFHRIYK
ncbi:MAG: hypothetical protein HQK51_20920 [Oligoflexia bacterium]|nr:hypothetical protein [Oligoflexia bacterium]